MKKIQFLTATLLATALTLSASNLPLLEKKVQEKRNQFTITVENIASVKDNINSLDEVKQIIKSLFGTNIEIDDKLPNDWPALSTEPYFTIETMNVLLGFGYEKSDWGSYMTGTAWLDTKKEKGYEFTTKKSLIEILENYNKSK